MSHVRKGMLTASKEWAVHLRPYGRRAFWHQHRAAERDEARKQLEDHVADETAAPGYVFVCGACGKTSRTRYGLNETNGWDESCMLNAVLCAEANLKRGPTGRVIEAKAVQEAALQALVDLGQEMDPEAYR